jgi:general secretion pathway protein B
MSYILDALRKSDQLRRRGAAPTLLLGETTATVPKRPAALVYGLLGLVLLIAGFAIGWMHPWQRQPLASAPPESAVKPPGPGGRSPALAARPAVTPEPQAQKTAPAAPTASAPEKAHAATGVKKARKHTPRKAVAEESSKAAEKLTGHASKATGGAASAAPAPLMVMNELPLAIQQEMPPLTISVHAYSPNPADRLVDINGRLLHEGDEVAPGLTLERITPNGMILSYKGYTFLRGVR